MFQLIAERPLMLSLMLMAAAAATFVAWQQTGRRGWMIGGLMLLCGIPTAWLAAERLVTDREQIVAVIDQIAAAVQSNDPQRVAEFLLHDDVRRQAIAELPRYRFSMAKVNSIREVREVLGSFPPAAEVELTVKVDVSEVSGPVQNFRVVRIVTLQMEKSLPGPDGGRWGVKAYQHRPITGDGP